MSFLNVHSTFLACVLAVISLLVILYNYRLARQLKALGDSLILRKFIVSWNFVKVIYPLLIGTLVVSLFLVLFKPVSIIKKAMVPHLNIHFILDNSLSMSANTGNTTRYDLMQRSAVLFSSQLNDSDVISATYFSGSFYPVVPPTTEKGEFRAKVSAFEMNTVPVLGSSIKQLSAFISALSDGNKDTKQLFIIMSDGDFENYKMDSTIAATPIIAVCIGNKGEQAFTYQGKQIQTKSNTETLESLSPLVVISESTNSTKIANDLLQKVHEFRKQNTYQNKQINYDYSWIFVAMSLTILLIIIAYRW